MRDRDRQREEYFTQRFIIFSLEPLPQNNDPKYAAVTEKKLDFGWTIRRFTFHQNSHGLNSGDESSCRSLHLRKHSHTHSFILPQLVSLPRVTPQTLEWVYFCFLRFSVSRFGCSLVPNLNVSPSGCRTEAHANRICLCSFTWNKIINAYFMVKKLIRIMRFSLWRGCTSTGKENIYKSCISDLIGVCGLL